MSARPALVRRSIPQPGLVLVSRQMTALALSEALGLGSAPAGFGGEHGLCDAAITLKREIEQRAKILGLGRQLPAIPHPIADPDASLIALATMKRAVETMLLLS